tara:strand:- start:3206 stop:3424 length:219 start_codon:yes stop_codon:yes gene_type:complete
MSARKGKPVYAYMFDAVNIPTESYGVCVRNKKCGNIEPQLLGNGLCLDCWDLKQYQFDRTSKKARDRVLEKW